MSCGRFCTARWSRYTRRSRGRNRSEAHAGRREVHAGQIGESKKSAGVARRSVGRRGLSASDLVEAIARLGSCGFDLEPVLLGGSGEEAPYAMSLPVGRLRDLGECGAFGPFDHRQDLCALAVGARRGGFGSFALSGLLARLGFFLRRGLGFSILGGFLALR